ncbi:histidine kinase [Candidatus Nitrosopumilus koreensis AR1]|uniref:Histidine kinase n=1 Tax=Candidatus Nitrosopumilus koreensis AR1 TaxID=1229908 RepID=K0B452_9ARCH|nr:MULTISPECIES: response regulator [Nitrosopumilus]AFS80878.1 histidine kinase [Candidatus Nitrosopumilus koreensis AR1]
MNSIERKLNNIDYNQQISKIIESKLIEIYGVNGYRSILKTIIENSKISEKEIVSDFELFSRLIQKVFGQMGIKKMLDPIEHEIKNLNITKKQEKRLLIADDESSILKLYQVWLEHEHNYVVTVENGRKCVEIFKTESIVHSKDYFDAVILDLKMPNMSGIDVAKEILRINPSQRIIFASGNIEKPIRQSIANLGKLVEVIEKPFSVKELEIMIKQKTILEKSKNDECDQRIIKDNKTEESLILK